MTMQSVLDETRERPGTGDVQIDSANTGMPLMQAQLVVPTCAECFRYYASGPW
jgi:hypothetical protein